MPLTGVLGSVIYYSSSILESELADGADFATIDDFTEIGLIESVSEFGRVYNTVTMQNISDGVFVKLKADYDDGQLQLTVAQNLLDSVQSSLKSYARTSNQNIYPFRISLNDGYSYNAFHFGAKVISYKTQMGSVNSVVRASILLEISTDIFSEIYYTDENGNVYLDEMGRPYVVGYA